MGQVLGPHARTDSIGDTRVAEPRLPAPDDGRPGEGQRLTPDAPHNGGSPPPPGDGPPRPPQHAAPTGHAGQGDSVGPPHPHTRAHSTWVADPTDAFPWGAWPRDAAGDTHKQAGRQSTALTGASLRPCHVTKRFRILATLKQGNKSMYSNTSGYVHMGLRLDWNKGITRQ